METNAHPNVMNRSSRELGEAVDGLRNGEQGSPRVRSTLDETGATR